jgi:hypothetical protein
VRKEPLAFSSPFEDDKEEDAYYRDVLEGTEPCLSEVANTPTVTRFSIKTAWPPSHSEKIANLGLQTLCFATFPFLTSTSQK